MRTQQAETQASGPSISAIDSPGVLGIARLAVIPISLISFAWLFLPWMVQWWVDGLWVLAIAAWMVEIRQRSGGCLLRVRPRRADLALLGGLLLVFTVAWLPFYRNWRWAFTGDSPAWMVLGWEAAARGLARNLLSVQGVDGNFTYLHSLVWNSFMLAFGQSLFWHRVGKLVASCLSLAAIFAYFRLTLGRRWAAVVVVCTAVNYVWLWFSYVSYGHIDTFIFYFSTLSLAALIWREPDHLATWMLCGLVGGFALFFTQTSWSAVLAVAIMLTALALWTRRLWPLLVYGVSGLLVAAPIILQLPDLLAMTTRQAHSVYQWRYLYGIFTSILRFPYTSGYRHIGVSGGFLVWPLGQLYVIGAAVAFVAIPPPVRRRLRVPVIAPVMLGLLLWDAVLMTLTNNGYSLPSSKRVFSLIPLQIFLALLPLICFSNWVASWRRVSQGVWVVIALVVAAYGAGNIRTIAAPSLGLYGENAFDGLIELRQRFPDRKVVLLTSREEFRRAMAPGTILHDGYRLLDQLRLEDRFTAEVMDEVCAERQVVCYEPNMEGPRMQPLLAAYRSRLLRFPLLNTKEMLCFTCVDR